MAIEFKIDGLYDMTFHNIHTEKEVEKDIEQGILDNLQQGEYVVSIKKGVVLDINDLENPVYKFELVSNGNDEYGFDEL